ncbi:MAG: extracellular solute-binding protein, partial [Sporomusaceae bacterium]|nr:extracellular solute-binding protein [Sporomusaceae bacterium]
EKIWNSYYPYAIAGKVAVYNNFGNYLAQTGKIVCVTSTSAGAVFYPSTVTYEDNSKENVEFITLPYPVFQNGEKVVVQRGGSMCVTKSSPEQERACAVFLKWLTEPAQNIRFAVQAGYMPVMEEAFVKLIKNKDLEMVKNDQIKKTLSVAAMMTEEYRFFFPPVFDGLDHMQIAYVNKMRQAVQKAKEKQGDLPNALGDFRREFDAK